jgi:hypothetical protein
MLTVGFFRGNYVVSRGHPSPDQVRARLDDVVTRHLPEALTAEIGRWVEEKSGVWLIRELEIDLDVDAGWDEERIAERWAEEIARRLLGASPTEDPGTIFFPDEAAYLARFAVDLASGRAWHAWYYGRFSGLRALAASAALRTALERDPGRGTSALARLEPEELETVLVCLSDADSDRLLDAFTGIDASPPAATATKEALEACLEAWRFPRRLLSENGEALIHFIHSIQKRPDSGMYAVRARASRALTRMVRMLDRDAYSGNAPAVRAPRDGDLRWLHEWLEKTDGDALEPLFTAEPEWIRHAARSLNRVPVSDSASPRSTPFGGAFLLLPDIASIPLAEGVTTWPTLNGVHAFTVMRFLILAMCFGYERAHHAFKDPLLRDLMSVPPSLTLEDVAYWKLPADADAMAEPVGLPDTWQADITPIPVDEFIGVPTAISGSSPFSRFLTPAARCVYGAFARRLSGFSHSSPAYLFKNFLDFSAELEDQSDRRLVRLGRAPLALILSMTGLNRQTYRLDWLDERRFELYQQD